MHSSTVATERSLHSVTPEPARPRSIFLRLHWMLLGAAALLGCALLLFRGGHSVVSTPSLGMWAIAASMVGARWLDISRFEGLTADGMPASRWHLRRYAIGVGAATAGLWGGALALA